MVIRKAFIEKAMLQLNLPRGDSIVKAEGMGKALWKRERGWARSQKRKMLEMLGEIMSGSTWVSP